jgi:5'-phosphate synthase pdxT subunit
MLPVGILALQGDFQSHAEHITRHFGLAVQYVKTVQDLSAPYSSFILPGGESSAMLKLMPEHFRQKLQLRCLSGELPVFATCAGCILAAEKVSHPEQYSLGLLDIHVERNSYGRQKESFATKDIQVCEDVKKAFPMLGDTLPGIFIRAPKITHVGSSVEVLARYQGDPVFLRGGKRKHIWCATFHPELEDTPSSLFLAFFQSFSLFDSLKSLQ